MSFDIQPAVMLFVEEIRHNKLFNLLDDCDHIESPYVATMGPAYWSEVGINHGSRSPERGACRIPSRKW